MLIIDVAGMLDTFWNLETNEQKKVAGPYATVEHAMAARRYFPAVPKLYVVEYQVEDCPMRASPCGSVS